eukprot:SAG25_NODE_3043_length_1251_cov_1.214410_1_plen_315_part_10
MRGVRRWAARACLWAAERGGGFAHVAPGVDRELAEVDRQHRPRGLVAVLRDDHDRRGERRAQPVRALPSTVLRDENRRGIGKSQSTWTDPKMDTPGSPQRARRPRRRAHRAARLLIPGTAPAPRRAAVTTRPAAQPLPHAFIGARPRQRRHRAHTTARSLPRQRGRHLVGPGRVVRPGAGGGAGDIATLSAARGHSHRLRRRRPTIEWPWNCRTPRPCRAGSGRRAHIIGSQWVQTPRHGDPTTAARPPGWQRCRRRRSRDVGCTRSGTARAPARPRRNRRAWPRCGWPQAAAWPCPRVRVHPLNQWVGLGLIPD